MSSLRNETTISSQNSPQSAGPSNPKMPLAIKKFYGVMWTLQDFVLPVAVVLKNGTILPAGTRFFSWQEAMALQRMCVFPKGYRLPIARELRSLSKNVGPMTMYKRLNFDTFHGFIDHESDGTPKISSEGDLGYYWSSSSREKHNAISLEIAIGRRRAMDVWVKTSYREYGNSIRLVYDPEISQPRSTPSKRVSIKELLEGVELDGIERKIDDETLRRFGKYLNLPPNCTF